MIFKKLVASFLLMAMCLSIACSRAPEETVAETSTIHETTTTLTGEKSDSSETSFYVNPDIQPETSEDIALHEDKNRSDEVIGNYEWNPYVWSDTLTEALGDTAQETTFNCISAVLNGDDTFEYENEMDVWNLMMSSYVVCPYLFKIIDYNIECDNGVATVHYICSTDEKDQIIEDFATEVEYILNASIAPDDSDEVKALMIHYNYSKTLSYDYVACGEMEAEPGDTKDHDDLSTYRAIVDREGICQSFAMALTHLYMQAGLDANLTGGESTEWAHMWVYMNLNGEEIFIDPTWEDSHGGTGLSFFGIDTDFYNDNGYEVSTLPMFETEDFNFNISSDIYEPLWNMEEILSIERTDNELIIEFIDSNGENSIYSIEN